jgi:tRNA pseudouridine55 synthase
MNGGVSMTDIRSAPDRGAKPSGRHGGGPPRNERRPAAPDGLIIVDKPAGWTSHDVVARLRRLAGTRRVGHAGTLDPMATGVLVVGVERATRLLGHLALSEKAYDAVIRLGQTTITDDAEGELLASVPATHLDAGVIERAVTALTGEIMQVPSAVSAVKVDGKRSYARVRSGETVELAARPVLVSSFRIHRMQPVGDCVDLDVSVTCSSGTYVRALARDLGSVLGVGGHLTRLRRTRAGPYTLEAARTLEELERDCVVLPLALAAGAAFPRRELTAEQARIAGHGGPLPALGLGSGPIALFAPDGTFVALVEERGGSTKSLAVFVG